MNDVNLNMGFFDDEESLEDILSEFSDLDEDFDEDLVVLAEKYGVDIEDFPMLNETDAIIAQYYDASYYEDENDIARPRPVIYDEFGRLVVYDEGLDGRRGEQTASKTNDKVVEDYFEEEKAYSQDDWRNSKKGRRKNMRRAKKRKYEQHHVKDKEQAALIVRFLRTFIPWKGDSSSLAASKVLLSTFVLILCVSVGVFAYSFYQNYKAPMVPVPTAAVTDSNNEIIDPREKYPDIEFPEGLLNEFVDLYAENSDFVGYLSMLGSNDRLNVPIVQSFDNKFYAENDFFKKASKLGTPYLDYKNDILQVNVNTVIYAGNIAKAYKTSAISDYKNINTFKKEPLITYWSRYGVYYYKIYAVMVTNGKPEQDDGYVFYFNTMGFKDEEHFEGYKEVLDQKKLYSTGVDLKYGDSLLTISAYSDEFDGSYTVIVARLVRDGEPLETDTSFAQVQDNPRYPQAWYDKRKLDNPYKNALRWQP